MPSSTTDVKQISPYELGSESQVNRLVQITTSATEEWRPSRYNARTIDPEGNILLWNSKTGAFTVFKPEQKDRLEQYLSQSGFIGSLDALGKYLRERGYLISSNINEYRQFQAMFGEQHYRSDTLELILLSSEDCNFRCKYCYEDFPRGTMTPEVRSNIKKFVKQRAASIRNFGVHWFGGEPLYGFAAIEELAPYFAGLVQKHEWNYSVTMTTNGYLLTPAVATELLSWRVNHFQITVDGPEEQHNANRPARDGCPTFSVILDNLVALASRKDEFVVRLRVNFDNDTHPHLESLLDILQRTLGSDPRFKLAFHPVGRWGGANDANLDVCGTRDSFAVLQRLNKGSKERGLKYATFLDGNVVGGGVCYAARPYNIIIGADGKVMKCTVALDKSDQNVVGELREGGELYLDQEKWARWVEPAFESDRGCQKCYLLPSCQGLSCPLIRIENSVSPCEATVKPNLHHHLVTALQAGRNSAKVLNIRDRS